MQNDENKNIDIKEEDGSDLGPLLSLKEGIDFESIKKNNIIDSESIQFLCKTSEYKRLAQKFVVDWRIELIYGKQCLIVWLLPTSSCGSSSQEVDEIIDLYGQVIKPRRNLTGIVHELAKRC